MLHPTRHLFVRQQNAVINSIRPHRAELGVVAPVGRNAIEELLDAAADPNDDRVPEARARLHCRSRPAVADVEGASPRI
jgi:transposase